MLMNLNYHKSKNSLEKVGVGADKIAYQPEYENRPE